MCIKLLFDQNLSYRLVSKLQHLYPDSLHIAAVHLDQSSDREVWNYAQKHGFCIVTKDSDFNELCALYNFPPHIIWLRLGNSRISQVEQVLTQHQEKICHIVSENEVGIIEING